MISKHSLSSKGLEPTPNENQFSRPTNLAKKKKIVYRFEDDQLIEQLMSKAEPDVIEHGLMAMDKRISIVGEIISLSEGRDKIFKIFSGILKLSRYFISRYFMHHYFAKEALSRISSCSSVTSNARMYLKLFTDWIFIRLALRVYFKQRWGWLKVLTLGRLTGLAMYFSCNVPIWLHLTKLVPGIDKNWWNKASLWCYIVSTICQFILDFKRLKDLTSQIGYIALFSRHPVGKSERHPADRVDGDRNDVRERGDGNPTVSMSAPAPVDIPQSAAPSQQTPSAMYRYRLALSQRKRETEAAGNATPAKKSGASPDGHVHTHNPLGSPVYPVQIAGKLKAARLPLATSAGLSTYAGRPFTGQRRKNNSSDDEDDNEGEKDDSEDDSEDSDQEAQILGYVMQHRNPSRVDLTKLQQRYDSEAGEGQKTATVDNTTLRHRPSSLYRKSDEKEREKEKEVSSRGHAGSWPGPGTDKTKTAPKPASSEFHFSSYREAFEGRDLITSNAINRERSLRHDRDALVVNFIKDGGEFASAYACVMDWGWSDLTNGLLSINSGCIALYRMWKRYKKSIEQKIEESRQRKEADLKQKRLQIAALEAAVRRHHHHHNLNGGHTSHGHGHSTGHKVKHGGHRPSHHAQPLHNVHIVEQSHPHGVNVDAHHAHSRQQQSLPQALPSRVYQTPPPYSTTTNMNHVSESDYKQPHDVGNRAHANVNDHFEATKVSFAIPDKTTDLARSSLSNYQNMISEEKKNLSEK